MTNFPKKYKPQDLHKWAINHLNKKNINNNESIYSIHYLLTSKKINISDFYLMYIKDFFNCWNRIKNGNNVNNHTNLFIVSNNSLENICSSFIFFNKKRQTLEQVGLKKLEKYIESQERKKLIANHKIIESNFYSPHKIFLSDFVQSDFYIYILNKFKELRNQGKITKKTTIGFRSFNLQTSISNSHIFRKDEPIPIYTVKYFVGAKCEALPICLEDIDLCCGDVALLVHPKDKRYNKYIGKNAIIPLCNRQIPIIGDETVNIAINNGIKRVCPCADEESIKIAKKYGLPTNIFVFNKDGIYTDYIHETFRGKERKKYYNNIVGFIGDIGNLAGISQKITKVPYLKTINERLTPFQLDEFIIDLSPEKEILINEIIENKINFSFINQEFGQELNEIKILENNITDNHENNIGNKDSNINKENSINELKSKIIKNLNIPNYFICNSQLPFGRRLPILQYDNGKNCFFDVENDYLKGNSSILQECFDFVLLCLIRLGTLGIYENHKLCTYEKIFVILSQNENKIQYFVDYLKKIKGKKEEYDKFIQIIQDLTDETNSSIDKCSNLIENSTFLYQEGNYLYTNIEGITSEILDPDFIQFCLKCYLYEKGIKINPKSIINKELRENSIYELLFQKVLIGKNISNKFDEYNYGTEIINNNLIDTTSQRDLFNLYGENPIRLNFLCKQEYNQQNIILNNIFLKQIWNAIRLCCQKNFLPKSISEILNNEPKDFNDLELSILQKLKQLYEKRLKINDIESYIIFFNSFKESIQDLFFSRFLEIQKVYPTSNVQFICSYFFNFLLTILYPLIPEYVDALLNVSNKDFLQTIKPLSTQKDPDPNIDIIYETFLKIKKAKLNLNIRQHESFSLFIKSTPSLLNIFDKYGKIFQNYFHISNITYLRLHEPNLIGYEIISDNILSIGIKNDKSKILESTSIDYLENELKDLSDKANLIKDRMLQLPEGSQRQAEEEKYNKIKEEMEKISIKIQIHG